MNPKCLYDLPTLSTESYLNRCKVISLHFKANFHPADPWEAFNLQSNYMPGKVFIYKSGEGGGGSLTAIP